MIYKLLSRLGIEVWKDIPEYEGIYQVSNLGRIKTFKFNKVKYLNSSYPKDLRKRVSLYLKNRKTQTHTIAVVVGMAFLNFKPSGNTIVIDHIDNNPKNDYLYNLQIISNRKNLTKDKINKTGYTGVYKCTNGISFFSEITNGKTKNYLGTFKNEIEASKAYQQELNKIKNE